MGPQLNPVQANDGRVLATRTTNKIDMWQAIEVILYCCTGNPTPVNVTPPVINNGTESVIINGTESVKQCTKQCDDFCQYLNSSK